MRTVGRSRRGATAVGGGVGVPEQSGGRPPVCGADRGPVAQAVVDTVDVAILTCDADGRLNYCNSSGRRLLGLPAGPARVGHGHADGDGPAPALRAVSTGEQLDGCLQVLHRALEEGHVRALELELVDADGRPHRWLLDAHVLRAGDGSSLGAVCTAHDITALRDGERALQASERRFRAAFENGPLPMARLTPTGTVLEANPALRRLLSPSSSRLVGAGLTEFTHPADVGTARVASSDRASCSTGRWRWRSSTGCWPATRRTPAAVWPTSGRRRGGDDAPASCLLCLTRSRVSLTLPACPATSLPAGPTRSGPPGARAS